MEIKQRLARLIIAKRCFRSRICNWQLRLQSCQLQTLTIRTAIRRRQWAVQFALATCLGTTDTDQSISSRRVYSPVGWFASSDWVIRLWLSIDALPLLLIIIR